MTHGLESLGRVRAQAIAFLAVAFVVGALCGAAVDTLVRSRRPPPPAMMHDGLPPFLQALDLTPAQRDTIRTILRRGRPRMDRIVRESMPRLRAVTDSVRAEIRSILTSEQRAVFDSIAPPDMPMGPGPGGPFGGRPPFGRRMHGGPPRGDALSPPPGDGPPDEPH